MTIEERIERLERQTGLMVAALNPVQKIAANAVRLDVLQILRELADDVQTIKERNDGG